MANQVQDPSIIQTVSVKSLFNSDSSTLVYSSGRDFEYNTCSNRFFFKQALPSGLIFLDPRPADQELTVIYPENYEPYRFDDLPRVVKMARDFVQQGKIKEIRKYASENGKILDVGCGNGALLKLARQFGPATWELHANELNQSSIQHLKQLGFVTHSDSIYDLPDYQPSLRGYFDVILLNQVIEHFADVRGLLSSCLQLLKPKGILFIETPSTEGLDAKVFRTQYWGGFHFPRHFYLFNEKILSKLLDEEGFRTQKISYLASPAFWIQSFHHFFLEHGWSRVARFFVIQNPILLAIFTLADLVFSRMGSKTSNMRMISERK